MSDEDDRVFGTLDEAIHEARCESRTGWVTVDTSESNLGVHVLPAQEGWHVLTERCRCRPRLDGGVVIHRAIEERPGA